MPKVTRSILVAFALSGCVSSEKLAAYQSQKVAESESRTDAKYYPPLTSHYDEFLNVTVTKSAVRVGHGMHLIFVATSSGRGNSDSSPRLSMRLESESKDWQFIDGEPVWVFLIDGHRTLVNGATRTGKVYRGSVAEWIDPPGPIPAEFLARMASAREIRGRINLSEFEVNADGIRTISQFARKANLAISDNPAGGAEEADFEEPRK